MSPASFVTVAVALVTVIGGGWFALRQARATAKSSPYAVLAERVVALEAADEKKGKRIHALDKQVTTLKESDEKKAQEIERLQDQVRLLGADKDQLIAYVRVMWEWAVSGSPPPPPAIPPQLHGIIPPAAMWKPQDPRDLPHVPLRPEQPEPPESD